MNTCATCGINNSLVTWNKQRNLCQCGNCCNVLIKMNVTSHRTCLTCGIAHKGTQPNGQVAMVEWVESLNGHQCGTCEAMTVRPELKASYRFSSIFDLMNVPAEDLDKCLDELKKVIPQLQAKATLARSKGDKRTAANMFQFLKWENSGDCVQLDFTLPRE